MMEETASSQKLRVRRVERRLMPQQNDCPQSEHRHGPHLFIGGGVDTTYYPPVSRPVSTNKPPYSVLDTCDLLRSSLPIAQ